MQFLYNIGIKAYHLGVITAGMLGSTKAIKWVEGRKNWVQKLKEIDWKNPIWVHASSLGEFEQSKPLIELIKASKQHKDLQIIVTFFSPSGYEYCKDYELADGIFYLPIDSKKNANIFLSIVNPSIAIFAKYDFWFNFLNALQNKNIPILYFSSNFRPNQFFFKKIANWQRSIMKKIDYIYCLNEESVAILQENGFSNMGVCGDTRYDKVIQNAKRIQENKLIADFCQGNKTLILGSSWPPEEELVEQYLKVNTNTALKIIIAPHDISDAHLNEIETRFDKNIVRYSQLTSDNSNQYKIVLIDNIGILSNIYQYTDIAFVGGGFSNDLHNILEPAVMGNALLYGNVVSKFPEGNELTLFGGSFQIAATTDFIDNLNKLLKDDALLEDMKTKSKQFVNMHKGATEKVFEKVDELIFHTKLP